MKDKCSFDYLLRRASALLMRRLHSKAELRKKLYKICNEQSLVSDVLSELTYLELVDDKRFAREYCFELFSKEYGRHKVRHKLFQRGIDKLLIDKTIVEFLKDFDERDSIRHLLEKKALDLTKYSDRTKAIRFLLNRGFDISDITNVLGDDFAY